MYVLYHSGAKGPYDIPLYRFRATKESFEDKEENPYNAGFCTPADNCMGSGVLNVSVCQHGKWFGAHFMNDFSFVNLIQWKIGL